MNKLKAIIASALVSLVPNAAIAQNGSNSTYSRFGVGTMAEQSQTFNRGMGGVAYGLRNGSRVNMLNPASYSAMDSLSFIMDVGMTMQYGHFSSGSTSTNVKNTTLSNVNAGFRVGKNIGMSIGFVPFSTIGYTFSNEGKIGNSYTSAQSISAKTTYTGSGGLHQIYIGAGWNPFADLSIGANVSYMWGDYSHSLSQKFYEGTTQSSNYSSMNQYYSAEITSYKVDFGIQYPIRITKEDMLTLGATYSLGHNLGGESTMLRYTSGGDSTEVCTKKPFDIPHTFGGGVSWKHKDNLLLAADMTYEKWADCKIPVTGTKADGTITYDKQTGMYTNRTRYAIGAEFSPTPTANRYMSTAKYRAGFSYSTPYVKVNGHDGPREMRASIGLGLPLQTRKLSGRSVINISVEWMMRKPSVAGMIKENYILLNLGVSFNERWFMKWKFE